jgi:hypothetical protein
MEFKGTKKPWEIELTNDYHEDCRIYHIPNIGIYFDENSDIEPEEIDANLLLISKAPEMLEMLEIFESYFVGKQIDEYEYQLKLDLKQLIKEATEL